MQPNELKMIMAEYATKYPPLLNVAQAAELSQRPVATIYDWSHRGKFDAFKRPLGREIRLARDSFVLFVLGETPAAPAK
ncbi:MAG: helix-turn-helix domain-containing protein [Phycisphaerae bacterium]